jgi:hypothetical protein
MSSLQLPPNQAACHRAAAGPANTRHTADIGGAYTTAPPSYAHVDRAHRKGNNFADRWGRTERLS